MAHFDNLVEQLGAWNGRRRVRDGLLWLPRGLLAGLLLAVLVAAAARYRPLLTNAEVGYAALGLALAGFAVSIVALLAQRRSLLQQARFADRQFRLRERASTAVEIETGALAVPAPLAQQQLEDTLRAAARVDVKAALPLRLELRDWLVILLATALLVTAVWLPNPQEIPLLQQRAVDETVTAQIEALEALVEEIRQNPELREEQQEELAAPLESAIEQLQQGGISREEAVAVLSEAEANLRELAAGSDQSALQQTVQNAGQPLAENAAGQSLGEALQSGNLSQAGAAAAQLADALPSLSGEAQQELAQDLAETAAALANTDSQLAQQLNQAAEALNNGDVAAAQQALREAAATLQQRAQEAAAARQAQQAAGQLQEGRQEVAQAGQQGEGQQGEGQQGEGQGQGSGQDGQGTGDGDGQGTGDGDGQGTGQGTGLEQGTGAGGPGPGGGHSENVYAPPLRDLSDAEGVDVELPAECIANPADCGGLLSENPAAFGDERSVVPYEQVFGDYRNAANEALAEDYIPLGLKGFIRDYFSSLEP